MSTHNNAGPAAIVREDGGRKWAELTQDLAPGVGLYVEPKGTQEPAAWQERQEVRPGVFGDWYDRPSGWSLTRPQEIDSGGIRYQFRPLYSGLPQAPVALTDDQIEACMREAYASVQGRNLEHAFARAIERAHGIPAPQTKGAE